MNVHAGVHPNGNVGDDHFPCRALLFRQGVDEIDTPIAILVSAFNRKPVTIREEKPGKGRPAGESWLGTKGQTIPDEGSIAVEAIGAKPRQAPDDEVGFVRAEPEVTSDRREEMPVEPVLVTRIIVSQVVPSRCPS